MEARRSGLCGLLKGPGPSIVTKKKDFGTISFDSHFSSPLQIRPRSTAAFICAASIRGRLIYGNTNGVPVCVGVGHVSAKMAKVGDKQFYTELGKVIRPDVRMDNPTGQWNYLEVRVEDGVVSTSLNGRTTVDRYPVKEIDSKFPEAGGIGLQAHAPWKEVRFRDIRVKELPKRTP